MSEQVIPQQTTLPYKMETSPGKEFGLVASRKIGMGERILCEKPIFTHNIDFPLDSKADDLSLVRTKNALPHGDKIALAFFQNAFEDAPNVLPNIGAFRTNGFPCGITMPLPKLETNGNGAQDIINPNYGVFRNISWINHDCIPNSHRAWNSASNRMTVHAIRDIDDGEEITIAYDGGNTFKKRQEYLKTNYGFICTRTEVEIDESDSRRRRIEGEYEALVNLHKKCFGSGPEIQLIQEASLPLLANPVKVGIPNLVKLMAEEYGSDTAIFQSGKVCYYAYEFAFAVPNQFEVDARYWAREAYRIKLMCEGSDSLAVKGMYNMIKTKLGPDWEIVDGKQP